MSTLRPALVIVFALAIAASPTSQEQRLLTVDDLFALKSVGDPRISPDGGWVAYTMSQMDAKKDSADTDIWMAPLAGGEAIRLTTSDKSESSPRWSPDGKYLGFVSSRDGKKSQVWLLPRAGGEASRLTDFKGGVSSFDWSPDGQSIAFVSNRTPEPDANDNTDIFLVAAKPGQTPRALTTSPGADG